jgi:prepilin-type N-terminal cleavage/methylation domain-containing protein
MKANQKGFSFAEILIVLVVVGLLGAVGWFVYGRQNNKTSETTETLNSQATAPQKEKTSEAETVKQFDATSFSLNTNKLPKGWTVTSNTADIVILTLDKCFIEAIKENDAKLSSSRQTDGVQSLLVANDKTSSKGYVVTGKGTSTLSVSKSSGSEKVTSYEFLWDLPDGGNPFRYSRIYSVQDGYYISLRRSCSSEAGFTNTDAAISAIIFKQ